VHEDQGVLLCREIEDASLTGRDLLRKHVEDWGPFRMFQLERIEHCIGNVQQMLPSEAIDMAMCPGVCPNVAIA
jgi:hypothetical protein